jgi:hypothetical protein
MTAIQESLRVQLLEEGYCSSYTEADAIVQCILDEQSSDKQAIEFALAEALDLSLADAKEILQKSLERIRIQEKEEDCSEDESLQDQVSIQVEELESEDGSEECIGDGECELCERTIRLTQHHLIPKVTWPRIESRLLNAFAKSKDLHERELIVGPGLSHLLVVATDKSSLKTALKATCRCCRTCHSTIHRTHDNMTLAVEFNTLERLLEDEQIRKFAQWANKQKSGKYAV